jgi:hypothetical protein
MSFPKLLLGLGDAGKMSLSCQEKVQPDVCVLGYRQSYDQQRKWILPVKFIMDRFLSMQSDT